MMIFPKNCIFPAKNLEGTEIIAIFAAESAQRMIKTILKYTLILALAAPATVATASEMAAEQQEPVVSVSQSTVTVSGAAGQTLEVVSLTGKCLMTVRIDSPSQRIELNIAKGCYIIKVGKVARKVTIR